MYWKVSGIRCTCGSCLIYEFFSTKLRSGESEPYLLYWSPSQNTERVMDVDIPSTLHVCAIRNNLWGRFVWCLYFFWKENFYLGAGKIVCVLCFTYIFKYINSIVWRGPRTYHVIELFLSTKFQTAIYEMNFFGSWF